MTIADNEIIWFCFKTILELLWNSCERFKCLYQTFFDAARNEKVKKLLLETAFARFFSE